jgi:hypothetical protein
VVGYMNRVLTTLGATAIGDVGVAIGRDPGALGPAIRDAHKLGQKLARSVRGEHKYPEQDEIHRQKRDYFCQLVKYNKDRWPHEYEWHVKMGWIQ